MRGRLSVLGTLVSVTTVPFSHGSCFGNLQPQQPRKDLQGDLSSMQYGMTLVLQVIRKKQKNRITPISTKESGVASLCSDMLFPLCLVHPRVSL